jgi:hypothetical protein
MEIKLLNVNSVPACRRGGIPSAANARGVDTNQHTSALATVTDVTFRYPADIADIFRLQIDKFQFNTLTRPLRDRPHSGALTIP